MMMTMMIGNMALNQHTENFLKSIIDILNTFMV
jgi:hypothetical protein